MLKRAAREIKSAQVFETKGLAMETQNEAYGKSAGPFAEGTSKWVGGGSGGDRIVAGEVRRAVERGISPSVEVEDSRRGTRGQLVGGTVEVQVTHKSRILFSGRLDSGIGHLD